MLGLKRLVRHAVAADVDRHQAELICQVAVELVRPTEMVLRPTVNKEYSRSLRIAPFPCVELETAASFNRVSLHLTRLKEAAVSSSTHGKGAILKDRLYSLFTVGRR